MDRQIEKTYGNRVRVRACGLCWDGNSLLMVNHTGLVKGDFWAPPGGGLEFGATVHDTVVRELAEETGLQVEVGAFLFGCELVQKPIHSVELFFAVTRAAGVLRKGNDPELAIIEDVRFIPFGEIKAMAPENVHGIFSHVATAGELRDLRGFFRI